MDYMLDGEWHKCISTTDIPSKAFFEEDFNGYNKDITLHWWWESVMDDIEEKQLNDGKQMLLDL
jgi:hypothetical protein